MSIGSSGVRSAGDVDRARRRPRRRSLRSAGGRAAACRPAGGRRSVDGDDRFVDDGDRRSIGRASSSGPVRRHRRRRRGQQPANARAAANAAASHRRRCTLLVIVPPFRLGFHTTNDLVVLTSRNRLRFPRPADSRGEFRLIAASTIGVHRKMSTGSHGPASPSATFVPITSNRMSAPEPAGEPLDRCVAELDRGRPRRPGRCGRTRPTPRRGEARHHAGQRRLCEPLDVAAVDEPSTVRRQS